MKVWRRHSWATTVAVALSACALGPLQPDLSARAPTLTGFGDVQWPITTTSPAAQRWFTQGVLQAYAFNEREAMRMFKAALAQDPRCAMCAWGVAWQLGPNINNPSRSNVPEALRYLDLAVRNASVGAGAGAGAGAVAAITTRERSMIDALALRYGHGSQASASQALLRDLAPVLADRCSAGSGDDDRKPDPLDIAYAERMRSLALAAPTDADITTLWAEAEMIATPGDWWKDGQPSSRIGEIANTLEQQLKQQPQHIGLNHYLIHAVDDTAVARRAEAAADRLGALAPASPHLVHMPSHTYSHIGRYADAAKVNQAAVAADLALMDVQKAQSFSVSKDWRNHNQHFLWFAALMQGQGDVAVAAAREMAGRAQKMEHVYGDYMRSLPMLALLRLQRWDAVLAEPVLASSHGLAQALGEQARGIALLRSGKLSDARAAAIKAQAGADVVAKKFAAPKGFDRTLREMASAASHHLQAEIALAEGRFDEALTLQARAVADAHRADDSEPPMLAAGAKLALADMQLRAGRPVLAEQTLRDDLKRQPGSGWALSRLAQVLRAQGKSSEADALQGPLALAWRDADTSLRRH
jgi:tetratricopeptide (TPR) repeat protein